MTLYLLNIIQPQGETPAPDDLVAIMQNVGVVADELKAAGAWVFAGGLQPAASASVVRVKSGKAVITDGPFAETKEYIGGLNIIDAPDRDTALEWGRRLAEATTLPIEVRSFQG